MPAPLQGLAGIYGDVSPQYTDQGVLEAHSIGETDPAHARYGQHVQDWPAAYGTGYAGPSYGPVVHQGSLPGMSPPGITTDRTPDSHSAPYARGIIQPGSDQRSHDLAAAELQAQQAALHGSDLGAAIAHGQDSQVARETPAHYTTDRYDAPNSSMLEQVPGQLRGNGTGFDTSQGFGRLNALDEFARGHSIRRVQHDPVPFDYTLQDAPRRPFWPHTISPGATFDGDGSPYGDLGGTYANQQRPSPVGYPTAPVPPAIPVVLPQAVTGNEAPWGYDG